MKHHAIYAETSIICQKIAHYVKRSITAVAFATEAHDGDTFIVRRQGQVFPFALTESGKWKDLPLIRCFAGCSTTAVGPERPVSWTRVEFSVMPKGVEHD